MTGYGRLQVRRRSGTAMILVVGYMTALTILLASFLGLLHQVIDAENHAEWRQISRNLAEAGIEKAIAELSVAPGEYRGEDRTRLGKGRFSVEVERGGSGTEFTVSATGELVSGGPVLATVLIVADVSASRSGDVKVLSWREVNRR